MTFVSVVAALCAHALAVPSQPAEPCDAVGDPRSCAADSDTDDVGLLFTEGLLQSTGSSASAWRGVTQWMSTNGADVYGGLRGNETYHGGSTIRGVVTTRHVSAQTPLLSVPKRMWLSLDNFPELQAAALPVVCSGPETESFKSAVAVALETRRGDASFFHSYLRGLPTMDDYRSFHPRLVDAPLSEDFGALRLVAVGLELQGEDARMEACLEAWKQEPDSLAAELTWPDVRLALARYRTRCYGVGSQYNALIPASDLLNTAKASQVNTNWGADGETFSVVMKDDARRGEELYDVYCASCHNYQMLLIWGIYLEDNPNQLAPEAGCQAPGSSLREATEAALDLTPESLRATRANGWTAPRCKAGTLASAQGPLRCSLARLAWESCAGTWQGGDGEHESRLYSRGDKAGLTAAEEAALIGRSAIHAVPIDLLHGNVGSG